MWLSEAELYEAGMSLPAAYDALKADPSRAIPAEDVRAGFEPMWAARS